MRLSPHDLVVVLETALKGGRASTGMVFGCTATESWVPPLDVCGSLWKGRSRSISVATPIAREGLESIAHASLRLMPSP